MTKTRPSLRLALCVIAVLGTLIPRTLSAQQTQQLVFTGLRAAASQGQFNAVQSAPNGDLYLLLDEKDGVRLLKTDANATTVLAQAQLGAKGDIGVALALDPSGNIYIAGTTTSGSLTATSGAAFPSRADASTNSFIAKFDASLNPIFVTFAGSGRMGVTSIATPCAVTTLNAGGSCSITLAFTPSTTGVRAGTLTITSSDVNSPMKLPLTGTGVPIGSFTLTANGKPASSATVKSGDPASYPLTLTPQNNFSGTVILNCTAIAAGQYATCALQPSTIAINGAIQKTTAILNTITTANATSAQTAQPFHEGALLCLLPAALLFFWKTRLTTTRANLLTVVLAAATLVTLSGCGSGGSLNPADISVRRTPPGTYQYQITATSTSGPRITQTVTLNLTVQ